MAESEQEKSARLRPGPASFKALLAPYMILRTTLLTAAAKQAGQTMEVGGGEREKPFRIRACESLCFSHRESTIRPWRRAGGSGAKNAALNTSACASQSARHSVLYWEGV